METKVTHEHLLERIVKHEDSLAAINTKLDPIVAGINSIAWAFKGLLAIGAGSAAVAGILVLVDRF